MTDETPKKKTGWVNKLFDVTGKVASKAADHFTTLAKNKPRWDKISLDELKAELSEIRREMRRNPGHESNTKESLLLSEIRKRKEANKKK